MTGSQRAININININIYICMYVVVSLSASVPNNYGYEIQCVMTRQVIKTKEEQINKAGELLGVLLTNGERLQGWV
jgi:hypothetical protein